MYTSNNRLLRFYQYAKQEKISWARWSKAKREKKKKAKRGHKTDVKRHMVVNEVFNPDAKRG